MNQETQSQTDRGHPPSVPVYFAQTYRQTDTLLSWNNVKPHQNLLPGHPVSPAS